MCSVSTSMGIWNVERAFQSRPSGVSIYVCPIGGDKWDVFVKENSIVMSLGIGLLNLDKHPKETYLHFDNGFVFHNGFSDFGIMFYNGARYQVRNVKAKRLTVRFEPIRGLYVCSRRYT